MASSSAMMEPTPMLFLAKAVLPLPTSSRISTLSCRRGSTLCGADTRTPAAQLLRSSGLAENLAMHSFNILVN